MEVIRSHWVASFYARVMRFGLMEGVGNGGGGRGGGKEGVEGYIG